MRILMVSPYPPYRDGIANYAAQEVKALLEAGNEVDVLSPEPSAARWHLDLRSRRGPLALAKRVRAYDRVIIQYHPDVFYPQPLSARDREATTLGLLAAFRACRDLEVRVHEINSEWPTEAGWHAQAYRVLWRTPRRLTVHTEPERQVLLERFGLPADRVVVVDHGGSFVRRTDLDRSAARARLGIPDDVTMFLSIGFIQPHKGFDRAVRAFAGLDAAGCRLDVVGSLRVDEPEYVAYAESLAELIAATPGVTLHAGYVSDELFDVWLVASDVVVVPYRHIWSSSVLERAAMYGRKIIATRVGGLEDQAPDGAVLVEDDHELALAVRDHVGVSVAPSAAEGWDDVGAAPTAVELLAEVRRRAAHTRAEEPHRFVAAPGDLGASLSAAHTSAHRERAVQGAGERRRAAVQRLRRPVAALPEARGRTRVGTMAKRLVQRATYWEVAPLVHQIEELRASVAAALDGADDGGGS